MPRATLVTLALTILAIIELQQRGHSDVASSPSATFTVTNTADSGSGSLRQAIASANASPGADTITFDTVVFAASTSITLTSGELAITDSVTVTGPGTSLLSISGNFASRVLSVASGNHNVTISGLTLINGTHTAPSGGGAILNSSSATLTLSNTVVSGNSANGSGVERGNGGAIYNAANGAVILVNSVLSDNSANGLTGIELAFGQGGGIFNAGTGTITLTNTVLSGNVANGSTLNPGFGFGVGEGGGIYNASSGAISLSGCTLSGNYAKSSVLPASGGGIFNASTGPVTLLNSTLSSNQAVGSQGLGGGIANSDGTLTITNSTIADNSGTAGGVGQGGGIYDKGTGAVTLINSTLTGNSVFGRIQSEGGGIFKAGTGTISLRNTLIAKNLSAISAPDVSGTFNSLGNNLIGDGSGSSGFTVGGDQVGTSATPINPLLSPLGNSGGTTQTCALLAGSPAIDAGNNCVSQNPTCLAAPLTTDQRGPGFARINGTTVDIGSFESSQGFEGDVAPRPLGNGALSLSDWVQAGRFAVGLDTTSTGSEFQRADCAPRETGGNGVLSLADWVQAGRYAAFLDPATPVAGPTTPSFGPTADDAITTGINPAKPNANERRSIMLVASRLARSPDTNVVLWLAARGSENAVSFSIKFDPSRWKFVGTQLTPGALGGIVIENRTQLKNGRVGLGCALPPGQALDPGWRQLVELRFRPLGGVAERNPIVEADNDNPVRREVVDVSGNALRFEWGSYRQQ